MAGIEAHISGHETDLGRARPPSPCDTYDMRKPARQARPSLEREPFLLDTEEDSAASESWFVYLFALADCSAFKVGFSCNPLQRICTFNRRFFEYFDLSQSVLLEVYRCESARVLEAELKMKFSSYRAEAPAWVRADAGGHTEWFHAVYFNEAEARLRSIVATNEQARVTTAFDSLRSQLERVSASFEAWAYGQAQRVRDAWSSAQRGYAVRDQSGPLRDWLDAYRYFDLPLFVDEPEVQAFVRETARGAMLQ